MQSSQYGRDPPPNTIPPLSSALFQHPCSLLPHQLTLSCLRIPGQRGSLRLQACHQPLDKVSSRSPSMQLWSLGLQHAPRSAGGPRMGTYHPARSGPKHPGWGATPQRFPLERQVEVHGQGGRGRPEASSDPGVVHTSCRVHSVPRAECAGTPSQVSPHPHPPQSSGVSPVQTSRSVAGAQSLLDPVPLSERQNASWIFPTRSRTPLDPSPVHSFLGFPKIPSVLPPLFLRSSE